MCSYQGMEDRPANIFAPPEPASCSVCGHGTWRPTIIRRGFQLCPPCAQAHAELRVRVIKVCMTLACFYVSVVGVVWAIWQIGKWFRGE